MSRGIRSLVVDLHGFHLGAAMETASWALRKDVERLTIITGRGLHSPGGVPVIKPELEKYLNRNGYWWHHPEKSHADGFQDPGVRRPVNPGAIAITRM